MTIEILSPIFSFLGGVAGTLGLFAVFPNYINNRLTISFQSKQNELLEKVKNDYQKQIEEYRVGLLSVARYSEYQFRLYNELWSSLYTLKSKAEDLWEHANTNNLKNFANQLMETKHKIEQNILLIDDEHYQSLIVILETFEKYKFGKDSLIKFIDRYKDRKEDNNLAYNNLTRFILKNEHIKNEYISLIELLAVDFKKHLKEPV